MTCKEAAYIISESLDHQISWVKRLAIKIHITLCDGCARYKQQLKAIKKISKIYSKSGRDQAAQPHSASLSDEARERIKANLRKKRPDTR